MQTMKCFAFNKKVQTPNKQTIYIIQKQKFTN